MPKGRITVSYTHLDVYKRQLDTDTSKPPHERVVKQFNKNGLYDAMDVGLIWLDKLNSEGK